MIQMTQKSHLFFSLFSFHPYRTYPSSSNNSDIKSIYLYQSCLSEKTPNTEYHISNRAKFCDEICLGIYIFWHTTSRLQGQFLKIICLSQVSILKLDYDDIKALFNLTI